MVKNKIVMSLLLSIGLTACSDDSNKIRELTEQNQRLTEFIQSNNNNQAQPQNYQQTPQVQSAPPVIVNQDHGSDGFLTGLTGFMLGHSLAQSGNNQSSTHIEKHYYERETPISKTPSKSSVVLPKEVKTNPVQIQNKPENKSIWNSKPSIRSGSSSPLSPRSSTSFSRPFIRSK